jgi:hypothetical protein
LAQDAARRVFIDITDDTYDTSEMDKVLALTDNLPLAISLLANLVDSEGGCSDVLNRWEKEKTSLLSEGYDRRSNLDLSISLSLSSPRITSEPDSLGLLGLLSILPDGLSDVELVQSNLPIKDIHRCKVALIRTALAYIDEHKQLKVLVPIREYMQRIQPPEAHIIRPLLIHFQELLKLHMEDSVQSSQMVVRISSNLSNIHILQNGLQPDYPDLVNTICYLSHFSYLTSQRKILLMDQIPNILPHASDLRVEAYFITELFNSWRHHPISDPEGLTTKALEH